MAFMKPSRLGQERFVRSPLSFSVRVTTAGFTPQVILQVDTSITGYHLAIAGNGAFFVRDSVLWIEASDKLCYYKLDDPLTLRDIFLYYRLDGRSRVEDTLLSFIRDMVGGVQKIE